MSLFSDASHRVQRASTRLLAVSFLLALTSLACDTQDAEEVVPVANTPEVSSASLTEESSEDKSEDGAEPGAGREVKFPTKKASPEPVKKVPTWHWALDATGREGITQHEAYAVLPGSESRVGCRFRGELNSDHVSVSCGVAKIYTRRGEREAPSPMWSKRLDGQFVDQAALVIHKEHLYVVHHSLIATGAMAMAFDIRTGKELWKKALEGVGRVSHSKYRNEVQVRIAQGLTGSHLVVYGRESSGRYIETLDLSSGRQLSNHKLESRYPELPEASATLPLLDKKSGKLRVYGTDGGTDISYTLTEGDRGRAILAKHATDGSTVWSMPLAGLAFDKISSFREHGNRVFLLIPGKESVLVKSVSAENGLPLGAAQITPELHGEKYTWLWQRRDNNLVLHHGVPATDVAALEPGAKIEMDKKFSHEVFEIGLKNELVGHIRSMQEEEQQAVLTSPGARWGARVKVTNTISLSTK